MSDQEKEQFSPVSVLDCPFDDDEEVSSPFQHGLIRMEGELITRILLLLLLSQIVYKPTSDNLRIQFYENEILYS